MSLEIVRDLAELEQLSVETQLFEVVRRVCVLERGVSMTFPEKDTINGWDIKDEATIGLTSTHLTHPLNNPAFRVKDSTLTAGDRFSAFSIRIGDERLQAIRTEFEYSFDEDPIAHEVLAIFKDFLRSHRHAECVESYKEKRSAERAAQAAYATRRLRQKASEAAA